MQTVRDLATTHPNYCRSWPFHFLVVCRHVMVRLKQPARQSTSYARFLGLLPRPEVTKSYRQPDSSNNDSTGPSNVYTSDTVCAERRDGFDITRSQAVHSPFCQRRVQKLAHMAIQQFLFTAVGQPRTWHRGKSTCSYRECLLPTWSGMQAKQTCMFRWPPAIWPCAGVKLLLILTLQVPMLSSCHC